MLDTWSTEVLLSTVDALTALTALSNCATVCRVSSVCRLLDSHVYAQRAARCHGSLLLVTLATLQKHHDTKSLINQSLDNNLLSTWPAACISRNALDVVFGLWPCSWILGWRRVTRITSRRRPMSCLPWKSLVMLRVLEQQPLLGSSCRQISCLYRH